MKKISVFSVMIFLFFSLFAQEEVTFNFTRKKAVISSASKIAVFVNGTEITKLKNGGSYTYKTSLDASQPVTVLVKSGLSKREIVFNLIPGIECNIETGFFGGMLDINLLSGGKLVPATGMTAGARVNKKDLSVSYTMTKTLNSDTIRQQWLAKGGNIIGMSYIGGLTFLSMNKPGIKMTGFGGQFAMTGTYLKFKVPEYKPGIRTWNSGVLGYTMMDQFFGSKTTIDVSGMEPFTSSSFSVNIMLSLNGGYTFGLGKFKTETKWKGAAFELTYRPSLVMSIPESGEMDVSFNATGFGFDINFNSFTSNAAKLAPKAQSKLTLFILPPVKDMPLYVNVGYGLTFYRKTGR